jgi:hypothetical protein
MVNLQQLAYRRRQQFLFLLFRFFAYNGLLADFQK